MIRVSRDAAWVNDMGSDIQRGTYLVLFDVGQVVESGVQYWMDPRRYFVPSSVQIDPQQIRPATVTVQSVKTTGNRGVFEQINGWSLLFSFRNSDFERDYRF